MIIGTLLTLLPAIKPLPWPLPVVPPLPPAKISAQMLFLSLLLAKSWKGAHGKPGCSLLRRVPQKHLADGQKKSVRSSLRNLWEGVGCSHTSPTVLGIVKVYMGLEETPVQGPCLLLDITVKLLWQPSALSFLPKISSERKYLPKHFFESGYVIASG